MPRLVILCVSPRHLTSQSSDCDDRNQTGKLARRNVETECDTTNNTTSCENKSARRCEKIVLLSNYANDVFQILWREVWQNVATNMH